MLCELEPSNGGRGHCCVSWGFTLGVGSLLCELGPSISGGGKGEEARGERQQIGDVRDVRRKQGQARCTTNGKVKCKHKTQHCYN